MSDRPHESTYLRACNGVLKGVLSWRDLDAVWSRLRLGGGDGWTLSRAVPVALNKARRPPRDDHRWWRRLLGGA